MIVIDAIIGYALFISATLASALLIAFGVLSLQEARDSINWTVYITVASSIGVGTAMVNSGISGYIAIFVVHIGESIGIGFAGVFGCIYLITVVLSYLVSSNVAVGLIYPIATQAAYESGADLQLMTCCVIFASSASCLMTPFAHTENSMIFGLGGYKKIDYLTFGAPLLLILWIVTSLLLSIKVSWYWSWVVSMGCFIISYFLMAVINQCRPCKQNTGCKTAADD
jgi:di/tricarboxylate transporter